MVSNIEDFIQYAKAKGIGVSISSNLNVKLDGDRAKKIILSGLDRLVVSCEGYNQESYEDYRSGGTFLKVTKNIKLLLDMRKECHSKTPYIEWQYLLTKNNENYVRQSQAIAKKIGVKYFTVGNILLPFKTNENQFPGWLPSKIKKNKIPDIAAADLQGRCWWLWRAALINWDGTLSPCCYVDDPHGDFGDLKIHSFSTIWNNEKFRKARKLFSKNSEKSSPCMNCNVYKHSLINKKPEKISHIGPDPAYIQKTNPRIP